jgi:putative ABC transport system permease protein
MRRLVIRLVNALRPGRGEDDLSRELAAHLALLEEEHRRRGLTADEARLAARRAMGSVALAKDLHRDARSFVWLDDLRGDLRHTVRTLRRAPGFTLTAVLALGLGIAVNTTFFTIVWAICLRGLPIDAPERVMSVSTRDAQDRPGMVSYAEFDDLRTRTTTFSQVGAYIFTTGNVSDDRQPPSRVSGAFVSAGAFELLGARPTLGRTFRADEDLPGGPPVVILGAEIWSSRYASDPAIVGQSITVNSVPVTIVGVMPRGFMFPSNADLWRPMGSMPPVVRASRGDRRLATFGRLAPGATAEQARAELAVIGASWARDSPATNREIRLQAVPINAQLNPDVMQRTWLAFITAGALVLLVACANVANLLLMRGAARGREMAIRTSIGATRARVVRQLLTESAVLASVAGGAGVLLAWVGLGVLEGIVPPETLPYWMAFTIDGRVLAVTAGVCVACVFVCGLPSALHLSRVDLRGALTDGGATTGTRPARRWIAGLLAAEFAVTLVLVSVAVMSVRAGAEGRRREFQIDPSGLLTLWVALPADAYPTPVQRAAFFDRLDEAMSGAGPAPSLAFASALPFGGAPQWPLSVADRAPVTPQPEVSVVWISERYFDVLGVPLVQGRTFNSLDRGPGSQVVVVNQRFVQMFLPDTPPIGSRIRLGGSDTPWLQIVGVATAVRQQAFGAQPDPVVFRPLATAAPQVTALVARTSGEAGAVASLLRHEVARLDPNLPLYRVMPLEQAVQYALWNVRLSDTLIRSIAVVTLLLALVGLYAVTGHTVEHWQRELGLRIALGARDTQVAWLVLRRILGQLGVGLALGLVGALAFDRLFNDPETGGDGIGMTDPAAIASIMLSIAVVAVVACLPKIRRAARVDPLVALRSE